MQQPDLAYLPVSTGHIKRNIRAKVIGYPEWMSEELCEALVTIVERRALIITGLTSGFNVYSDNTCVKKVLAFNSINIYAQELSGCEISETMNAWVDGAIKALADAPSTGKADVQLGLSIAFYEVNGTHTVPVRSWLLREVFPTDTGLMSAMLDLNNDRKRDEPLEDAGEVIGFNFTFDQEGSDYNTESVKAFTLDLLKNAPKNEYPGYAEALVPGSAYVFTIDEHDPDPKTTVEFLQQEFLKTGNKLVVLTPEAARLLHSEEFQFSDLDKHNIADPDRPLDWETIEGAVKASAANLQSPDRFVGVDASDMEITRLRAREQWLQEHRSNGWPLYVEWLGNGERHSVESMHVYLDKREVPAFTADEHILASVEIPHTLQEKKPGNELPEGWTDPNTPKS